MISTINILVISVSLALDAFSVSVAGGMKAQNSKWKDGIKIALFFGGFQAIMPIFGWLVGITLENLVNSTSHWIAFVLLFVLGLKMIKESFDDIESKQKYNLFNNKTLILLSIATSIDAFIIGITLNLINIPLLISALVIGIVTFILCLLGFILGRKLGSFFAAKVEIIGGLALIILSFNVLMN